MEVLDDGDGSSEGVVLFCLLLSSSQVSSGLCHPVQRIIDCEGGNLCQHFIDWKGI
jgi:hypothetical protein